MAELLQIFIPGILADNAPNTPLGQFRDTPEAWHNQARLFMQDRGVVKPGNAMAFAYYSSALGGPLHDDEAALRLANILMDQDEGPVEPAVEFDLTGHSNGVKIILRMLALFPVMRVRNLFLIAGAVPDDCDENGLNTAIERDQITGRVYCFVSPLDEALGLGAMMGYGQLGKVGPHNVSHALQAQLQTVVRPFRHNEWVGKEFSWTMDFVAKPHDEHS